MKKKTLIITVAILLIATLLGLGVLNWKSLSEMFGISPGVSAVKVEKKPDGAWQLLVNGEPYVVKGVVYEPVPIGKGPKYDWWQDSSEPWRIDAPMMKKMGVNSIRVYDVGQNMESVRNVVAYFYKNYGIMTAIGDYLDFWEPEPANYGDPGVRQKIMSRVIDMVKNLKDTPGVLFWVLGNENNYSFDLELNPWTTDELEKIEDPYLRKIEKAKIYYSFINDMAKEIHKIDKIHPVVMGNGEMSSIEVAKEVCADVDIIGSIAYRGKRFGAYWSQLKNNFNKPAVFIEFGCDSFNMETGKDDQDNQALYIASQWKDISKHTDRDCLGGFVFEWADEWWKHNDSYEPGWLSRDEMGSWSNASYYDGKAQNNMNEEWWGVVEQSPELSSGVNKRVPKKAYYVLQELWKNSE